MAKSVSFIIPTYCTEESLFRRCIESVVSLPTDRDIEIIVVDDGTPDSKVKDIISEINDNRIIYCYQENGGLSRARNTGTEKAVKDYIHFLDSDDYLLPKIFNKCLNLIDKYEPDLLMFKFKDVFEHRQKNVSTPTGDKITHQTDGISFMLGNSFIGAVCNMLIKRELTSGLSFTPGIFHEDEEYKPLLLLRAKKMIVTGLAPYAYYHHRESITGDNKPEKLNRKFNDMLYVIESLRNRSLQLSGNGKSAIEKRTAQLCEAMLLNVIRLSPDKTFFERWLDMLKQHGIYPFPNRKYNFNYKLFRFATGNDWKIRLIYRLLNRK